ncbi:hypothetical protein [Actinomycetospora straminea]|uniref:Uncharacterized protein n=1 Tax=Actinomycetospora straminea TaxID=663607 RepID=A0ABP9FCC5_9PSEU|nr:hypothetical protein [Actinomycetospora straminea]MDD7936651.1 hypothetical protein [Actinomycetospora straminea]
MDATGDHGIARHHTADGRRGGTAALRLPAESRPSSRSQDRPPDDGGGPAVKRVRAAAAELRALLTGDVPARDETHEVVDELAALVQLAALAGHAAVGRRSDDVEGAAVRFTQALQSLRDDPGRDD